MVLSIDTTSMFHLRNRDEIADVIRRLKHAFPCMYFERSGNQIYGYVPEEDDPHAGVDNSLTIPFKLEDLDVLELFPTYASRYQFLLTRAINT